MSDVEAAALSPVEPLTAHHSVDSFDCGKPPLDHFLQRFALINQKTGSARTYVVCRGLRVVGYYGNRVEDWGGRSSRMRSRGLTAQPTLPASERSSFTRRMTRLGRGTKPMISSRVRSIRTICFF